MSLDDLPQRPMVPLPLQQYARTPIQITRRIEIDMGHRVTNHHSKCKNVHGHRYVIELTVEGSQLVQDGSQQGMVLDFGFVKDMMMTRIYEPCDHGLVLWANDPLVIGTFTDQSMRLPGAPPLSVIARQLDGAMQMLDKWYGGKLLLVPFVPTAEHLAQHWALECAQELEEVWSLTMPETRLRIVQCKVWETPNCSAVYVVPPSYDMTLAQLERDVATDLAIARVVEGERQADEALRQSEHGH